MNRPAGPRPPAHYELRIEGHLGEHWSAWFGGLTLTREPDGTTTLRGAVSDQAELHGLLTKVRDLGATLISVTAVAAARALSLTVDAQRTEGCCQACPPTVVAIRSQARRTREHRPPA